MATLLRDIDDVMTSASGPLEERAWGTVASVASGGHYRIHCLVVNPGASLDLDAHEYKTKQWVVISGTGRVMRDEAIFTVAANDSVFIPPRAPHALKNAGGGPLCIIEVEVGARLDEIEA